MRSQLSREEAERLVQTYSDLILRLSFTYLKNTEDAKDICQTVFLRLLEKPREFQSPEHERAWIIRTSVNVCKDQLKSSWRRTTVDLSAALDARAPEAEEGSLWAAVALLPPKYRTVIYLYTTRVTPPMRSPRCWGRSRPQWPPGSAGEEISCGRSWNRRR